MPPKRKQVKKEEEDDNDVINIYETPAMIKFNNFKHSPTVNRTGIDYGSRVLVCSGTGGGKTNFIINFLLRSPKTFSRIFFLMKQRDESLYQLLEDKLKGQDVIFTTNPNELGSLDEKANNYIRKGLNDEDEILVILDDFMVDLKKNEDMFLPLFMRGRKKKICLFILQQSYTSTPKDIRRNCSHVVLLKLSGKRDINNILREVVPQIDKPKEFIKLFNEITSKPMNFMKIHMGSNSPDKIISKNFIKYIPLEMLS